MKTLIIKKMPHRFATFLFALSMASIVQVTNAGDLPADLQVFVQKSCVSCHDENTETRLDLITLKFDLKNENEFRHWVHIYDRVDKGEMPPSSEPAPDEESQRIAMSTLGSQLKRVNRLTQKSIGRVPSRRLSRLEYEHTLHDLLGIGGDLAKYLPPESESGEFDVLASAQEMSSVHVQGLLKAADEALDEAIQIGKKPRLTEREIDYFNSPYIQMWVDREVRRGGGTIFKTDQDVVTFRGENFVFRSDTTGFRPPVAGNYRIKIKAAPHNQRSSITVSLKRQNDTQGESALIAAWDLAGEGYRDVETVTYLRPDDYFYVSADELEPAPDGGNIYGSQPASQFQGEGVKIQHVSVQGPLEETWPPQRTRQLFPDVEWKQTGLGSLFGKGAYEPALTNEPSEHIRVMVANLAPKAFGRVVSDAEIDALTALAKPSLEEGRNFIEAARIPLRAILVSPHLLYLTGDTGPLDDFVLARRLSLFLWRSLPDDELIDLADQRQLNDPAVLAAQVDRMLTDSKSDRFIQECLDQWLDLSEIDATTPDPYLYPEYDDILRQAMLAETYGFFTHLIDENLSVGNLIDADFTFLNRRLAEHYGIDGVEGEEMRRVWLPADSVRGGLLTQASIAKVTANGTVTTPVRRGNFVLTSLLGTPPNPPPPRVGSIEPDTRGATTIREMLIKHQANDACAVCHRRIDPPGFALECFDPVGHLRDRYRLSKGVQRKFNAGLRFLHKDYKLGPPVETGGITADGYRFEDIRGYKSYLKDNATEQVARNVLYKLIEFSTGGEVEFADRDKVERILRETQDDGYPMRDLIHQVVASRMFRRR